MKRQVKCLLVIYCALASYAWAAEPDVQAMVRADAYVNLSRLFYSVQVSPSTTIKDIASSASLRNQIDAALLAAPVVEGSFSTTNGVSTVAVELDTQFLPSELKSKVRNMPDTIRVEGVAVANATPKIATPDSKGLTEKIIEWLPQAITTEGSAPAQRTSDPDRANKDARRKALVNAFTELLKKVDELAVDDGVNIRDYIAQREELREGVKSSLAHASLVKETFEKNSGTHKVEITFTPNLLPPALRVGTFRAVQITKLNRDQISLARENALASARQNLKLKILAIPTGGNTTIASLIEQKPSVGSELDSAIRLSQIENVEVLDNGLVKLSITITTSDLPSDIQKALPKNNASRITAIGGGLSKRSEP